MNGTCIKPTSYSITAAKDPLDVAIEFAGADGHSVTVVLEGDVVRPSVPGGPHDHRQALSVEFAEDLAATLGYRLTE